MRGDGRALLSEATCSQARDGAPVGVPEAESARSCWYRARQADSGREEKGATAASWPRAGRAGGRETRGSWRPGLCIPLPGPSATRRGFEVESVPAPTRNTPKSETGRWQGAAEHPFASNSRPSLAREAPGEQGSWLCPTSVVPQVAAGRREDVEVGGGSAPCTRGTDLPCSRSGLSTENVHASVQAT